MLALSSSYELATTYLQVFLLWMFCSELVLSFACVNFVITGHFLPVGGLSILRANLASTEKSAAGKVGLTLPRFNSAVGSVAIGSFAKIIRFTKKFTNLKNNN